MLGPELPPRVYASLRALCCLAKAVEPLQAYEIASTTGLPPAQTAKILQMMTWAGFVESRRGTKGGFWLVTPARSIRVTDILDFFARRTQKSSMQLKDPIAEVLTPAFSKCQEELAHITVADLAKAPGCEQPSYGQPQKSLIRSIPAGKRKRRTDSIQERSQK